MQALLDAIATAEMPTDAQRLFHGRGALYPGSEAWTLDAYPPVWLVTKFGEATAQERLSAQRREGVGGHRRRADPQRLAP